MVTRERGEGSSLPRRAALAWGAAAIAAAATETRALAAANGRVVKKGRLKQSVSRWCYGKIELPVLCKALKDMGLGAIDLLHEPDWGIAKDHGLVCSMAYAGGGGIGEGLNDKKNHDKIVAGLEEGIPKVAALGWPNVISFFGNRRGDMDDWQAFDNCVEALDRVKAVAERHKVTICVELLNSKVDHKGYQGDHVAFGARVIKAVASPNVKLLYDIYHMQIMDGDTIRTIRTNKDLIAHFHTGGVPGRHELDETQELNWRTVASAIVDMGFTGYFAHEFVPTRDPLTSLRQAVTLCDV